MKTFKIRDLMIGLRPGIGTPQRPKPFDCCIVSCDDISDDCGGDSIQPFDSDGGCDFSDCDFSDCDDVTCICTDETCGCTQSCGCTRTCGCTLECSQGCTKTCIRASCGVTICRIGNTVCHPTCADFSCVVSLKAPQIEQMAPAQLARLKAQLRAKTLRIKKRESVLAEAAEKRALAPETVEQVDSLEKMLSEALEALRARRAELQKAAEAKSKQPNQKNRG